MGFSNIGLAEPSTITKVVASVTVARGSTTEHQEVMCLGDVASSNMIARVSTGVPSTEAGLITRGFAYCSSAADFLATVTPAVGSTFTTRPVQSSAADLQVTATPAGGSTFNTRPLQSSAADLQMTATPASGSTWRTQPGSTAWASSAGFHFNSSGELQVTGALASPSTIVTVARTVGNSSAVDSMPVRLVDSSGTGFLTPGLEYVDGSTVSSLAAPGLTYANGSNTTMRLVGVTQPLPVQMRTGTLAPLSLTTLITSTASTAVYSLASSGAGTRHKVTAYFIGSTHTLPSTFVFMSRDGSSGATTDLWAVNFGSGSSGITGANLATTAPDFLFATVASEGLHCRIESASSVNSTQIARVSVGYFAEA